MILDEFGRPTREATAFITPKWIMADCSKREKERAAMLRVMALRESVGIPQTVTGYRIGNTISVRLPKRFTENAPPPMAPNGQQP